MSNDYSLLKTVAILPDATGMYRVSYSACSDFAYESPVGAPHRWSDENLAELVRTRTLPSRAIRCDRETWLRAHDGRMNGYSVTSDVDADVIPQAWAMVA